MQFCSCAVFLGGTEKGQKKFNSQRKFPLFTFLLKDGGAFLEEREDS